MEIPAIKSGIQLLSIALQQTLFNRGSHLESPNLDNHIMEIIVTYNNRDNFIDVTVSVKLIKQDDPEPQKADFSTSVTMIGVFEKVGEFPLSDKEFAHINAAAIIFPYVRQHIRSLSLDAGMNPILIPLVNFQKMYKDKQEKDT